MKDPILESLNAIRKLESTEVLNEAAAAAPVAQAAGKGIGRFIPGVGAALGAYDAYGRAKQGDWAGAGLSALGGAASLIPGVGTAASLGIAGAQALRDKQRTGSYLPSDDEIAGAVAKDAAAKPTATAAAPTQATPTPPGADPKVLALQKQLIAKGAKNIDGTPLVADGKMGKNTQAAMKQFPGVAVAEQNKGNDMSESQKIAELMSRLTQIESQPQVSEAGALSALGKGISKFRQGMSTGFNKGAMSAGTAARAGTANKAGNVVGRVGKAAVNNRGTVGLATGAAAGAAGMAALAGNSGGAAAAAAPDQSDAETARLARQNAAAAPKPAAGAGNKPAAGAGNKPAPAAAPAATANAGPDKADVDALNAMAAELENSQDPADVALMQRYNGIINAINNRAAGDKRTNAEIAANASLGTEPEPTK